MKVVTDKNRDALYFSRLPIPCNRDQKEKTKYFKHIGIYGYTKDFLSNFVSLPESFLERTEALEQLRVLENNMKIRVMETEYETIGVDRTEQITIGEEERRKGELI